MDWDKLKVFHAAAEAGSFTHAGERLGLSQSAVSRQVSALEGELSVSLFHRHARGLILTEQGELLYRTAHEVFMKLEAARTKLTDSRERPNGELKVSTTPGIGVHWLTPRLGEFLDLYPDIHITLITTDEELDLAMREADVAIRLRQPTQPDLIQRKLFSVHFHAYASPDYLKRFGTPRTHEDLDKHRIILLGGAVPAHFANRRWLLEVGRDGKGPRTPNLTINNVLGVLRACQRGLGVAMLPDYLVEENGGLVQLFGEADTLALDAYFVYPEGTQVGRPHPGFSRLSGRQRAALAFLDFHGAECPAGPHTIRHGSYAADGVAGPRTCTHTLSRCCTGCISSQSRRCISMFPSGRLPAPHAGKIEAGPPWGPVFYGRHSQPSSPAKAGHDTGAIGTARCNKPDRRSARRSTAASTSAITPS